jgi:hemin uptake protein HemP
MAVSPSPAPAAAPGAVAALVEGCPTFSTAVLFGKGREIVIRHGSAEYRLRITKANKLILTK